MRPDALRLQPMDEAVVILKPAVELAVKRSHSEVWDRETGNWLTLDEFSKLRDYGQIIRDGRVQLELKLLDGSARYVCPHCKDAMVIRSKRIRERSIHRFYFEHGSRHGRETCAGKKGQSEKAILARKFGQSKEGALHLTFKRWIRESLDADAQFSDSNVETRWWDVDGVRWRQPDVQSTHQGSRIAFEVQLSTTFIHVIAERMKFYRENEGRLVWLFKDLDLSAFQLAHDDIFYANNRNAFRVTPATLERSKRESRFVLECLWLEPQVGADDRQQHKEVFFDQLRFDTKDGIPRCYWYDYDTAETLASAERMRIERQETDLAEVQKWVPVRKAFEGFYIPMLRDEFANDYQKRDRLWTELRRSFAEVGIELPEYPRQDTPLGRLLIAGYSSKSASGHPIGIGFSTLVQLGHHFQKVWPEVLWFYRCMLLVHGKLPAVKSQDHTGKFLAKMKACLESIAAEEMRFQPDRSWDRLLVGLFPEVAQVWEQEPAQVARAALAKAKRSMSAPVS